MLFRKRALLTVLIIFLISANSNAEPGNVQRWLMDTPVSLWTFGMSELNNSVSELGENGLYFNTENGSNRVTSIASAYYEWEKNRIIISAHFLSGDRNYEKTFCETYLNKLREHGAVHDGEVAEPMSQSLYSQNFLRGFTDGSEPANYTTKIDEIIEISVTFHDGTCRGSLLATDIFHKTE